MKKSKFIAMIASFAAVAACAISAATTVSAAEPSVNLVKVDDDTVAVYFANIPTAIWTWDATIDMTNVTTATWRPEANVSAVFDTAGFNFVNNGLKITMASAAGELPITTGQGTKMGEIDLTIVDSNADVVLTPSIVNIQDVNEVNYQLSKGTIAAPALTISNAPVVDPDPETPVDGPSVNLVKVDDDTVAVYFANIPTAIWTWDATIDMTNVTTATWRPEANVSAVFDTAGFNFVNNGLKITMASAAGELPITTGQGTKMGEIDLTIVDSNADVVLTPSIVNIQDVNEVNYQLSKGTIAAPALTIEGAQTEEPDPEPPVVEPEPETIPATSVGMFTEWEDAPAQAFKANLTAAQSAKTVTWIVTDGTNTTDPVAANLGTPTGIDMVIGLIVTNAVDGLTATVVVE